MQRWVALTFRNSPDEFPFTHVVQMDVQSNAQWTPLTVLCGASLPDTMAENLAPFFMYIDTNWVSCDECQRITRGNPREVIGRRK